MPVIEQQYVSTFQDYKYKVIFLRCSVRIGHINSNIKYTLVKETLSKFIYTSFACFIGQGSFRASSGLTNKQLVDKTGSPLISNFGGKLLQSLFFCE